VIYYGQIEDAYKTSEDRTFLSQQNERAVNRGERLINLEIAGFRRNLFKGRVIIMIFCGRLWMKT
jgi:hypothetical protein